MSTIEVRNPHNSQHVKIRPQDVGKAQKDGEGRIFYVIERPDGDGYYTAMTKAGGQRDIDRYDKMMNRSSEAKAVQQQRSQEQIASAQRSSGGLGKLIKLIIFLAIIGGGLYYFFVMRGGTAS